MTKNAQPSRHPRIALHLETSLASGRDILRGVAAYAREKENWSLFQIPGTNIYQPPVWINTWEGDGIIARVGNQSIADAMKRFNVPVVDVLGMVEGSGFPVVHVDNVEISRMAYKHFDERGFRNFAFIGFSGKNWSEQRKRQFEKDVSGAGRELHIFEMNAAEHTGTPWDERQDRMAKWLLKLPKPIAIMVCSDQHGMDVLEACQRVEIQIPSEAAVLSVDNDSTLCEACSPPLSSVWPDHFTVGYRAAELLAKLLRGEKDMPQSQLVTPQTVVTRQSSDILAVEDPVIARALQVIQERACLQVSVDEIADAVGISRSVLQRRFHSVLGKTVHDYLVATRLNMAVQMVSETDLPLKGIADRCGFKYPEYMTVVFRQRLGRTPSSFRNPQLRRNGDTAV